MEPHEVFIGLHYVDDITTNTIVHTLKDTVLRLNLNMSMCRARYDGASNMKKAASEIKAVEPRALYLHYEQEPDQPSSTLQIPYLQVVAVTFAMDTV